MSNDNDDYMLYEYVINTNIYLIKFKNKKKKILLRPLLLCVCL